MKKLYHSKTQFTTSKAPGLFKEIAALKQIAVFELMSVYKTDRGLENSIKIIHTSDIKLYYRSPI